MKKRIISLTLAAMMLAVTLIGCGNSTNENVTPETNTEVTTETPTPDTTTPEVDVPETEVGDNDVDVETFFSTSYALDFPEGMTGFTDKYVFSSDETWSLNNTHYVDNSGNTMNFEWEGPTELGEKATTTDSTLALLGGDYALFAWTYGYADGDFELCANMDKETWTSFTLLDIPYVENGYYNVDISDNTILTIFEVEGLEYKGYASCITDSNNKICYQFTYVEKIDSYNEERAMKVIESIKFWNYEPTNE